MKRRNLIFSMGILAMGSGAAALSGATLTNAVSPAASFRVNVEGGLEVAKGAASFPAATGSDVITTGAGFDNSDVTFITSDSSDSSIFDELDDDSAFTAVADDDTDDALHIGVAFPFSAIPDSGGTAASFEFPDLITITNNDLTAQNVSVTYGDSISSGAAPTTDADNGFATSAGSDVSNAFVSATGSTSNPTQLSFDEAAEMFQFTTGNGNPISPAGSSTPGNANQDEAASLTISGDGAINSITLEVEISTATGQKIHDFVSEESLTVGSFAIIDQIFVGVSDASTVS
jgi:hypothetical protein